MMVCISRTSGLVLSSGMLTFIQTDSQLLPVSKKEFVWWWFIVYGVCMRYEVYMPNINHLHDGAVDWKFV